MVMGAPSVVVRLIGPGGDARSTTECTVYNLHITVHVPTLSCVNGQVQRRRRDAESNRDLLLEAALRALAEDPDAGLDAVARTAGLSRRTVYGHFPSREALITALAQHAGEGVGGVVRAVRDATSEGEHPLTT